MDIYITIFVTKNGVINEVIGAYNSENLAFEAIEHHSKLNGFVLDGERDYMYGYVSYHSDHGWYEIFCRPFNAILNQ